MRSLLAVLLATAASISVSQKVPAAPAQTTPVQSRVMLDEKGDVARFYGIPMNLTPVGLKRLPYRYKVGHGSAEGDTYTFYTIKAQDGVEVDIQFNHGKLYSAATTSLNAVGPNGVGVGSLLSDVKKAWPKGNLYYGIGEAHAFVTFETAEEGFMPNVMYGFDPKDLPAQAFDRDYRKAREVEIPDVRVKTISIYPYEFPEATYDFLAVTTGRCAPKTGIRMSPKQLLACKRMTPKRRYRGTWLLTPQASLFAPAGKPSCIDATALANCAELVGKHLDSLRPYYRDACPILYRLEFIGRRNVLPGANPAYRIEVEEVLADRVLPDAPKGPGTCKEAFVPGFQEPDPPDPSTKTPPAR